MRTRDEGASPSGDVSRPALLVRDIGCRAGSTSILERVSFDVSPGEFVAVMGRNGAGKSTLFDLIAGLRAPTTGTIQLGTERLDRMSAPARARMLAHLPQDVHTHGGMDAESLVMMGRYGHRTQSWFETNADHAIVEDAMRRCGCLEFRRRALRTLSGGERQRVLLAACLAQRTPVLLLDEPATFLDVDQQLECFSILRSEADRGVACLAVTHDVNLALTFCTRVIVLAGRAIAHDSPAASSLRETGWLSLLSTRMRVRRDSHDVSWVHYQ